jgi:hypothetical protein
MRYVSLPGWLTAACVLAGLVFLGMIAGALVATRVMTVSGMGWDQIADTLGGLMVGGAVGLVAGLVAVRMLDARGRLAATAGALLASVAAAMYLQATPPNMRRTSGVPAPEPPVASFTFQLSAAEGLGGPGDADMRPPWALLRVASNLSLDYVPIDRPEEYCRAHDALRAPEAIAALSELRSLLAGLPGEVACSDTCQACMEVDLQWLVNDERRTASMSDRCWRSLAALQPLRASVERIVERYGTTAVCERSTP